VLVDADLPRFLVPGREAFADFMRAYPYLLFFNIAGVAEDRSPGASLHE